MNKAKQIIIAAFAASAAILTGCAGLTNLTPERVPENSSRVYTLSMSAYINDGAILKDSIEPYVVIDEKIIPMNEIKGAERDRMYEYDYVMPENRKSAKYYFLLKYQVETAKGGLPQPREMKSPTVYTIEPATRYIVSMQNERGPVGASIPVLGRGFDKEDKVVIGGVTADTEYLSRSTVNFTVPPLASGKTYDVELVGINGEMWIGRFRVDNADIGVSPQTIDIASGDIVTMIFSIGFNAPKGGYPIDVKTNIPSSVVMDEIIVPEGQNSVSVSVKGAAEGRGLLFISGLGFNEKKIPVEVKKGDSGAVMEEVTTAVNEIDAKEKTAVKEEKKDAAKVVEPAKAEPAKAAPLKPAEADTSEK